MFKYGMKIVSIVIGTAVIAAATFVSSVKLAESVEKSLENRNKEQGSETPAEDSSEETE